MKFLFYFICITSLGATCTEKEIQISNHYYQLASQSACQKEQIRLIEKSLKACYAPEIDVTLLMIKAQNSSSIKEQIDLYKQALVSVSRFKDSELLRREQNRINLILSKLYTQTSPNIAKIYDEKIQNGISGMDSNKESHLWVWILFAGLFVWSIWNFRMLTKR